MKSKSVISNFRRISEADVNFIVVELDKWAVGALGSKLTWAALEKQFRFSRQSMQAKPKIKAAYLNAKQSLSGGLVRTQKQALIENDTLNCELNRLKNEVKHYQAQELEWKKRWQRIAYHLRQHGYQMSLIDRRLPDDVKGPGETEASKILNFLDKEIPPSGRV